MINVSVPGFGELDLRFLVLDFNGTLACDGQLLQGVAERLNALAAHLEVYVITADTFGKATSQLSDVQCRITILDKGDQAQGKLNFVEQLGARHTVCMGNGRNDQLMLNASALGIALVLAEGASVSALEAADIVCTDILHALDLLDHPLRLVATLRS